MSQRSHLKGAGWMQSPLGLNVGGSGFLAGSKIADCHGLVVDVDSDSPTSMIGVNTHEAGTCPRLAPVLVVLLASNNAKVCEPVVITDAVDVVNLSGGPFAVNVQPNDAVRCNVFAVDLSAKVAQSAMRTKARSGFNICGTASLPLEFARILVVVQKFLDKSLRKARLLGSHLFAPLQQMIGEKPEAVTSVLGLRYFTTRAA